MSVREEPRDTQEVRILHDEHEAHEARDTRESVEEGPPTSRDPLLPLASTPDLATSEREVASLTSVAGKPGVRIAPPVTDFGDPVVESRRSGTFDAGLHLEELVARENLSELCVSFFSLF
ncbi:MAG TPA: hypothetical protein VNO21_15335, partial [Polyangiaceae bacterium]|nr:hypothetical protein [Polyangiaceae bacterium]